MKTEEYFPRYLRKVEKIQKLSNTDIKTSPSIVDYLIYKIKKLGNKIILDPSCGRGIFLVKLYDILFLLYRDIIDIEERNFKIIQSIIGIEKEFYYASIAKQSLKDIQIHYGIKNILEPNIIIGDFLKEDTIRVKFDIILGNPPYQREKGINKIANGEGSLYVDFIKRSSSLLRENGEVFFIGPINYLKATNFSEKSRTFEGLEGLEIIEIENGIEKHFSEKEANTFISFLHCKKSGTHSEIIKFNGEEWDLKSFPFVFARGESEMIEIFKEIWPKVTDSTLGERLDIRRVTPAKIRSSFDMANTPMLSRVYRGKELKENGILRWGNGDKIGNQTQIVNLSLSIDESNLLFSSKMFRIIFYLSYFEPTVYHNFLKGLVKPKNLILSESTTEEDIMLSYGISNSIIKKIKDII